MKTKQTFPVTFPKVKGAAIDNSFSLLYHLFHCVAFELKKPRMQFETAMFIVSIDVDAGSKKIGIINGGRNDANVHKYLSEACVGDIEERAIPLFNEAFNDFEVPATFGIRGQLTELANPFFEEYFNSSVDHDIGAHGYYHRNFQMLTKDEAKNELSMIAVGLKKFGVTPKSFIFPRNAVGHLNMLEKFGYKCYREGSNFRNDGMFIEKKKGLFNIQPSLYLLPSISPLFLRKILDIAVAKRVPLHLWFHPWNFGRTDYFIEKYIENIFRPLLKHAKTKEKNGVLTFETMLSAAEKAESLLK